MSVLTSLPRLVVTDLPIPRHELKRVKTRVDLELACDVIVEYLHKPPIPGMTFDLTVAHLVSTHRPDGEAEYDWMNRYFRELIYGLYRYFTVQGFYVCGRLPYEYARLRPGDRLLLKRKTHFL